jgi:hypothetical protein
VLLADGTRYSTGNLVGVDAGEPYGHSTITRQTGDGVPAQVLHSVSHEGRIAFGALARVWADNGWFLYFVVDDRRGHGSHIARIPQDGGEAVVLRRTPGFVGGRPLVSDGTSLYWADERGIHALSVDGVGRTRTLAAETGVHSLWLAGPHVYFTTERTLRRVPVAGGVSTLIPSVPRAAHGASVRTLERRGATIDYRGANAVR